ncbi:MFS transporter [Serratia marcescens]|uniref:MFS transporter n=1 Tax=Serratia marcescens TaxID=615 RepID=A0A939SR22_SERMA|nr:MFS transporter [Serratia marcescens]
MTAIALVIAFIQFTNARNTWYSTQYSSTWPPIFRACQLRRLCQRGLYAGGGDFRPRRIFWIGGVEKQRFLLLNVTLLGVTTLLIATTQQFYWLLALRLLAGLLGGTTMGVGIGLLLNAAPRRAARQNAGDGDRVLSLVSIVGMPGMLYLCEVASWRAALVTIGGLCLLAAVLVALFVPRGCAAATGCRARHARSPVVAVRLRRRPDAVQPNAADPVRRRCSPSGYR